MRRARHHNPRLPRAESTDPAKRPVYVWLDLVLRALSAIGLLALGVAGWWFQVSTARNQASEQRADRESRRVLPALRALIDVELTASEIAERLTNVPDNFSGRGTLLATMSTRMNAAAVSTMVVPDEMSAAVDLPNVKLVSLLPRRHITSVRATSFALSDLLLLIAYGERTMATGEDLTTAVVGVYKMDGATLGAIYGPSGQLSVVIRPESFDLWQQWIGDERVSFVNLRRGLSVIARAVQQQAVAASQSTVRAHPEFGDQYVSMRGDALASRSEWPEVETAQ